MKIFIKLIPPYTKSGRPEDYTLELPCTSLTLKDLAWYITKNWDDRLQYSLLDDQKLLNAELTVNERILPLEHVLKDGDRVVVFPYVGGG